MLRKRLLVVSGAGFAALLCGSSQAWAQTVGNAQSFAIVGGAAVNANGSGSLVNGNVGINPAAATNITGFPGNATILLPFSNHGNDPAAVSASAATLTLYNSAVMAPAGATSIGGDNLSIGGPTSNGHYTPGRYTNIASGGVATIPTSITLDGPGIYVFTFANALTATGNVILNGVDPCTVFWRTGAGAQATLNSLLFSGTVVADGIIALGPNATVTGRALTTATGSVTLAGNNRIGGCSTALGVVPPTVTKAFSPAANGPGGISTLTITLTNPNATAATLSAPLVDSLPAGVTIASSPNASTTCGGGLVTATAGGSLVTLSAGSTIPAGGSCTVIANVTASTPGSYTNTIAVDALQTSNGNNIVAGSAILTITAGIPPVPTLSEWAMIVLAVLLCASGFFAIRQRWMTH